VQSQIASSFYLGRVFEQLSGWGLHDSCGGPGPPTTRASHRGVGARATPL
jgi:hypothetical protein